VLGFSEIGLLTRDLANQRCGRSDGLACTPSGQMMAAMV
jgi:hypothetical protein